MKPPRRADFINPRTGTPVILNAIAVLGGLTLLVWSANRFIEGAAALAKRLGMPPLLIGMVIVGFGTSAPELTVSVLASWQGNPGVALGNAYGSNIANIALILGLSALVKPIMVQSQVVRKELPILTVVSLLAAYQLWDGTVTRADAVLLLGVFAIIMAWTIRQGVRQSRDALASEVERELPTYDLSPARAAIYLIVGLVLLIVSSRVLVWGAVGLAKVLGVSDLVIGLTVIAVGTSLPELASSIAAARKNEDDLALGNILGSNLFNTLMVVGLAGLISPISVGPDVLRRDVLTMGALTVSLFAICYGFGRQGRINRFEGGAMLAAYALYLSWMFL